MNGAHDLGGMDGFGPIEPEPDEPVFHGEWERRVFAMTVAMGFTGAWNIDMSRHARERADPAEYLRSSLITTLPQNSRKRLLCRLVFYVQQGRNKNYLLPSVKYKY